MSRVVLRNKTAYPDNEVRDLIRFAFKGLELPSRHSILVRLSYCRTRELRDYAASGVAHDYVYLRRDTPKGAAWEVHLRVAREKEYPLPWVDRRENPIGTCADWREALVAIAAHEGKHIEEFQRGGVRQRLTGYQHENRCDAFASGRVRLFRKP